MRSDTNTKISLPVNIFFLIFISYFSYKLTFTENYRIFVLDDFNLLIHESGHLVFAAFGQTISLLGGTILQLLIPIVFLLYFAIKKDFFGSIFSTFWFGENLINVATYIKDAQIMALPLVGGGIHDWNSILSKYSLVEKSSLIGNMFFYTGLVVLFISLCLSLRKIAVALLVSERV